VCSQDPRANEEGPPRRYCTVHVGHWTMKAVPPNHLGPPGSKRRPWSAVLTESKVGIVAAHLPSPQGAVMETSKDRGREREPACDIGARWQPGRSRPLHARASGTPPSYARDGTRRTSEVDAGCFHRGGSMIHEEPPSNSGWQNDLQKKRP